MGRSGDVQALHWSTARGNLATPELAMLSLPMQAADALTGTRSHVCQSVLHGQSRQYCRQADAGCHMQTAADSL